LPLPPIPKKLSKIDQVTITDHHHLRAQDECFYIWDYETSQKPPYSPANQFIYNQRIKPTELGRIHYKQQAIQHGARALCSLVSRRAAEIQCTIVPMPGSKIAGHPDYDDRLSQMLTQAFVGLKADIQPLLQASASTHADHLRGQRTTLSELLENTVLLPCQKPVRPTIIVLDDVLTSGKHFRVASDLLNAEYPQARIVGLFLARRYFSAQSLGFSIIDET
jgi:hypothetical protein